MKRILLTIALIAMFAAPASAQLISLWADEEMTQCGVYPGAPPNNTFDLYVFVEPDGRGLFGAEFKVVNPSMAIFIASPGTGTANPAANITVSMGAYFGDGISLGFSDCHYAPIWVHVFPMISYEGLAVYFTLEPAATGTPPVLQDHLNGAICDVDHTKVEAFAYNEFGVNADCVVGTKETSWGAIKSMMD
jgi:hypothetical protein